MFPAKFLCRRLWYYVSSRERFSLRVTPRALWFLNVRVLFTGNVLVCSLRSFTRRFCSLVHCLIQTEALDSTLFSVIGSLELQQDAKIRIDQCRIWGLTLIKLENVSYRYSANEPLIEDISFTVNKNEKLSILGPGGCGKSTVLKMICGLVEPKSGVVSLFGEDLSKLSKEQKIELLRSVGVAFQQGGLFDFMTVKENLCFAMEHMTNLSKSEMDSIVDDLLAQVKLSRTKHMFPFELSGGMQRRVGIARALCTNPVVAIFDEPAAGLDPVTSTIILNMIAELGKRVEDSAYICCTSNVEIGVRFAERVIVINEGQVVADGLWKELLVSGSDWVQHFLGTRFIGLDIEYARGLNLPEEFVARHWNT